MTRITFQSEDERIAGFVSEGHSGWAESGADIVCAAVTAAVRMTECTLNDVLGAQAAVSIDEKAARIALKLPAFCEEEAAVQAVLTGLMLTLCELRDEYPDFIEVMEV